MNLDLNEIELLPAGTSMSKISAEVQFIGFYFAAHWAPPARNFVPKLTSAYQSLNSNNKKFEVIFISFDRDEESFEAYSESMPWPCVPFKSSETRVKIAQFFQLESAFKLVITTPKLKIISKIGIEDLKEKGVQCLDWWALISENVKTFSTSPFCEKGHSMNYVNAFEKIRCAFCKGEIVTGWNCIECKIASCQICEEWLSNSVVVKSEKLLCLRGHSLRRSHKLNEYYLKKFLNGQYSCRTCNSFPSGEGLHCYSCLYDVCENCERAIELEFNVKCLNSHSLVWSYDLCMVIQEKYKRCEFQCEKCHDSFMGGGAFACLECEFYVCLRCIKS